MVQLYGVLRSARREPRMVVFVVGVRGRRWPVGVVVASGGLRGNGFVVVVVVNLGQSSHCQNQHPGQHDRPNGINDSGAKSGDGIDPCNCQRDDCGTGNGYGESVGNKIGNTDGSRLLGSWDEWEADRAGEDPNEEDPRVERGSESQRGTRRPNQHRAGEKPLARSHRGESDGNNRQVAVIDGSREVDQSPGGGRYCCRPGNRPTHRRPGGGSRLICGFLTGQSQKISWCHESLKGRWPTGVHEPLGRWTPVGLGVSRRTGRGIGR